MLQSHVGNISNQCLRMQVDQTHQRLERSSACQYALGSRRKSGKECRGLLDHRGLEIWNNRRQMKKAVLSKNNKETMLHEAVMQISKQEWICARTVSSLAWAANSAREYCISSVLWHILGRPYLVDFSRALRGMVSSPDICCYHYSHCDDLRTKVSRKANFCRI